MKKSYLLLIFSVVIISLLLTACGQPKAPVVTESLPLNEEGNGDLIIDELLTKYKWLWQETIYTDNTQIKPQKSDAFILTLNSDGTMSATTDCNNMFGNFTVNQNAKINFPATASTQMYCEDSQETEFATILDKADSYFFEEDTLMISWENNEAITSFTPLFR